MGTTPQSKADLAAVVSTPPRHSADRPRIRVKHSDLITIVDGTGATKNRRELLGSEILLLSKQNADLLAERDALKAKIELAVQMIKSGRSMQSLMYKLCDPITKS